MIITQLIYITKKVALESPATALKVFFAGNKVGTSDLKVLFKILRTDDASDFDELNYEFFNTTGVPDGTVATSLTRDDFQEYLYTAGVTDDGIGDSTTRVYSVCNQDCFYKQLMLLIHQELGLAIIALAT